MEAEKIIEMLRAEDNCDVLDYIEDAADCIEMLLEEIHNATVHADCMEARASAFEAELNLVTSERDTLKAAMGIIPALQAELEASQRRERAAVKDLTENIVCGACVYQTVDVRNAPCDKCGTRHGFKFEWRGPEQEGE